MKCRHCTLDHPGYVTCREALVKQKAEDMRVALTSPEPKAEQERTVKGVCPVCEARRLKDLARVRKYRERKTVAV